MTAVSEILWLSNFLHQNITAMPSIKSTVAIRSQETRAAKVIQKKILRLPAVGSDRRNLFTI